MADSNMQLNWTDEQWNKVRQVVYEEARRARVAGNILPLYGPLEPDADFVRQQTIAQLGRPGLVPPNALSVNDRDTLQLSTLQVEVFLRGAQVADPELTSALMAFRRAASILARLEDSIVLTGQLGAGMGPPGPRGVAATAGQAALAVAGALPPLLPVPPGVPVPRAAVEVAAVQAVVPALAAPFAAVPVPPFPPVVVAPAVAPLPPGTVAAIAAVLLGPAPLPGAAPIPPLWQVTGGEPTEGLLYNGGLAQRLATPTAPGAAPLPNIPRSPGEALVGAISDAIGQLEQNYHLGPFACVLDQIFFNAVQTPDNALVLPQDRILPFLAGGPLVRSSALPPSTGLVIALGGEPVDLVVATDICVSFLQATTDPYYVFRVSEKIVLRIKQPNAIVVLC